METSRPHRFSVEIITATIVSSLFVLAVSGLLP